MINIIIKQTEITVAFVINKDEKSDIIEGVEKKIGDIPPCL